jgi:hypothetical protein
LDNASVPSATSVISDIPGWRSVPANDHTNADQINSFALKGISVGSRPNAATQWTTTNTLRRAGEGLTTKEIGSRIAADD